MWRPSFSELPGVPRKMRIGRPKFGEKRNSDIIAAFFIAASSHSICCNEAQVQFRDCGPRNGQVAQSVEQRTENPCVGGSIPPLATSSAMAYTEDIVFSLYRAHS